MSIEWKDTTSYARGGSREPKCWAAKFGDMTLIVLTGHIYYPNKRVMHFAPFYEAKEIGAVSDLTSDQAKETAMRMAALKISEAFRAFGATANEQA